MMTVEMTPITAEKREEEDLRALARHLSAEDEGEVRLTDAEGHELVVPTSVLKVLPTLVRELARGSAVAVVPIDAELTTQQAADFLQVSRPYVVRLLDDKELPGTRVGTHRRVKFADLVEYRRQRDATRREGLSRMIDESDDRGLPY